MVIDTDSRRTGLGAIVGLLTAAVAIGVAQLVAGIVGADSSPVVAVQEVSVGLTPPGLKNFAISTFGANDKLVLLCGVLVVLALFAALIGVAAMRRLDFGLAGLVIFAVIGILAAITRPHASAAAVLPTLIGAAAGAGALVLLLRAAQPAAARRPQAPGPQPRRRQAPSARRHRAAVRRPPPARPGRRDPGPRTAALGARFRPGRPDRSAWRTGRTGAQALHGHQRRGGRHRSSYRIRRPAAVGADRCDASAEVAADPAAGRSRRRRCRPEPT